MKLAYDVIIPVWNAEKTIIETLESIAVQTVKPNRVIVVDDGSTDGTKACVLASNLATHVITIKNQGPGAATTRGFSALQSDFVAFCDSDDIWLPDKAEVQLQYLVADKTIDGVFCDTLPFRDTTSGREFAKPQENWGRSVLMIKAATIAAIGPIIDPEGGRGELIDWIARGREMGIKFEYMKQVMAHRRISATSLSNGRKPERDIGYLQVAHAALLRKRARGEVS